MIIRGIIELQGVGFQFTAKDPKVSQWVAKGESVRIIFHIGQGEHRETCPAKARRRKEKKLKVLKNSPCVLSETIAHIAVKHVHCYL